MFDIGFPELVVIMVVALLIFGPTKMIEIGRDLGKGLRDFRKATSDVTKEFNEAFKLDEPEKPAPVVALEPVAEPVDAAQPEALSDEPETVPSDSLALAEAGADSVTVDTVAEETAPVELASTEPALVDVAPDEAATVDTEPVELASTESALVEVAPAEFAPTSPSLVEVAPDEAAPVAPALPLVAAEPQGSAAVAPEHGAS
jgi:sec-independent protein translocase protein TatA